MSNRTMLEINHDYAPHTEAQKARWLDGMLHYLRTGDPNYLPAGVTFQFRSPHVHEQMQELSDRIRAIPDEIAAIEGRKG